MPAKKTTITDEERAKRIRETARKAETSNDPKDFDRAFEKIVGHPNRQLSTGSAGKPAKP